MNFLNQILVWGGLAFSIPLVIHLLNRSRFRTIDWGAMHLLDSVIKVNHRRLRIEQLILLLVRCSIPILLAFCLARPVLTGPTALEGNAPVSLVVVIDNSYSMDTREPEGSRWDQAVTAANQIIGAASRGSEVFVLMTGTQPTPLYDRPVFDPTTVVRQLNEQPGGMGASDFNAAISEALETLVGMTHARRELIVISDFQPRDWQKLVRQREALLQTVQDSSVPINLTYLPLGKPIAGNVSVESLEYSQRAIGVDQVLNVRANLRNWGNKDSGSTKIELSIDGQVTSQTQVNLPAESTTQVLFPCRFKSPGSHVIQVELVEDDALATDNARSASINVWNSIDVVLVDGAPDAAPLKSETDYLSIALTPLTLGRTQLSDLIQTRTVEPAGLNAEEMNAAQVVVLANVSRLNDTQLELVEQFVDRGGTLLIFLGNRVDLNWYNQSLFEKGLLPAKLGALQGSSDAVDPDKPPSKPAKIIVQNFEHPALALFNDPSQGNLSSVTIQKWYALTGVDRAESNSKLVLAWLNSGEPLLVEQRRGDGAIVLMATACDADWSDFPLQQVYVPFVQQLVTTQTALSSPPRNIRTGETATARVDVSVPVSKQSDLGHTVMLLPSGQQRTVPIVAEDQKRFVRFRGTQQPGVYSLDTPTSETVHFVASTVAEESDPSLLDSEQVQQIVDQLGGEVVSSADEYLRQDRVRRHGREIWKYVLVGLLIMMGLEVILQQRFAGVKA